VEPDRHDAAAVGDEALLLAAAAPTWVARRRADGAAAASAAGAPLLVMDDGFQHPGLARDLALLVVDGATGFGNGAVIPAGPLREPIERGLARADAVIVIGEDRCGVAERLARRVGPPVPLLRARLVPDPAAAAALRGKRVLAFAGIGRPEKFFQTCREVGAEIVEQVALPDHHAFRTGEIATLTARAATLGAIPVTTSKDAARLPPALRAAVPVLPVAVAWERPADLEPLLGRLLTRPRPGTADG
jgi:tetraacyldisaccharide 4'-kinase